MVRMLHRETMPSEHSADTKVEERVRRVPTPSAEEVRALVEGPPRRPVRWMRWLGLFLVFAAAGVVATLVVLNDDSETTMSQVPRSADGAEGWILATQPVIVSTPHSADGLDLWHEYLDPKVPRTADGAEGWIVAARPEAPAAFLTQLPEGATPEGTVYEGIEVPTPPTPPARDTVLSRASQLPDGISPEGTLFEAVEV